MSRYLKYVKSQILSAKNTCRSRIVGGSKLYDFKYKNIKKKKESLLIVKKMYTKK
jgi:hypothetical protein